MHSPSGESDLLSLVAPILRELADPLAVTTADGTWGDGRILDANPAFERLTGLKAQDIRNRPYRELCQTSAPVGSQDVGGEAAGIEATVVLAGAPMQGGPVGDGPASNGQRMRVRAVSLPGDSGAARMRVIAHQAIGGPVPILGRRCRRMDPMALCSMP